MGSDPWSHTNKEWQETLRQAKEAGCSPPEFRTNHQIKDLQGPDRDPLHRIKIYSTGKGSGAAAREARKKIRKCAHGDFSDAVSSIERNLEGGERLMNAAESLWLKTSTQDQVDELLEQVGSNISRAEEQLHEKRFDELMRVVDQLDQRLSKLEKSGLSITDPQVMFRDAQGRSRRADLTLRDKLPSQHETYEALRQRTQMLKERIAAFKEN